MTKLSDYKVLHARRIYWPVSKVESRDAYRISVGKPEERDH
jgi:hypothetical protein